MDNQMVTRGLTRI